MLRVLRPGALASLQDLGRQGLGRMGVSCSGAMDPLALRVANRLLGNAASAPALELTGPGVQLQFERATWLALAGADLLARIGERGLASWQSHRVEAGSVLAFEGRSGGARAYVAVAGGLRVEPIMGSVSTDLDARIGGLSGAPLRRGDLLDWSDEDAGTVVPPRTHPAAELLRGILRWYEDPFVLSVVMADETSTEVTRALLESDSFRVGERSSRMGFRLEGPPVPVPAAAEAISEAIAPGALQMTADGQPILLMADRQTVGGYPVVAHLARAHVPKAAQLWPGDRVRFRAVSVEEAQRMAREQEGALAAL